MRTIKLFLAGFTVMLLGACYQPGEKVEPLSKEESEHVISFYYQQPDTERLLQALATFDEPGIFNPKVKAPLMGFLSALAMERPQDWQLVKQLVFEDTAELNRMWASVPRQQQALEKMMASKGVVANSAAELDFLWGAFSATGDERFVQIIARTASFPQVDPLVRAAAQWSLSSQRKTHPAVERVLQAASQH